MTNDLGWFRRRMAILARRVDAGTERLIRRVALVADQALVFSTPVDTGRARSNWIVSIDQPASATVGPYSPGQGLGVGETANAQAALNQAAAQIDRFRLGANRSIFISNNLPYIERLNDGHSAQAPAGFVESAVQAAARTVQGARILTE
jgi:hypothetical protein